MWKKRSRLFKSIVVVFLGVAVILALFLFRGNDDTHQQTAMAAPLSPEMARAVLEPFVTGMTVAEVEKVLGKPGIGPKPWKGGSTRVYFQFIGGLRIRMKPLGFAKRCNTIQAEFDEQDKLTNITLHNTYWQPVLQLPSW